MQMPRLPPALSPQIPLTPLTARLSSRHHSTILSRHHLTLHELKPKPTSQLRKLLEVPNLTMDGLSAAASGMAVVCLAFQLGESIKQLHDFWDSIKEAPDDIHAIQADLELLMSVLAEMANEVQHSGPDQTLTRALKACCDKANKLTRITDEIEPGFASRSLRIRKWIAFKAVFKKEKIHKFQKGLEGLKSTLILAQQSSNK